MECFLVASSNNVQVAPRLGAFVAMLRPCTTSAGFMAVPEQSRKLDMPGLKEALADAGFEILRDARVLLLIRKGVESTIYHTGKVLLKTTDGAAAEASYQEMRPLLEAHWA